MVSAMKPLQDRIKSATTGEPSNVVASSPAGRVLDQRQLQRLIGYNLRRAEVQMRGEVARALAADDIRAVEYSILSLVTANREVTQKELGETLSVKRPNMVSLIERLEQRGLIVRAVMARDRRNQILSATDAARVLLARLDAKLDALEQQVFGPWSQRERELLAQMLRRIYSSKQVGAAAENGI